MRILAMVHGYVPYHNAGAETTLHELLKALAAAGHNVNVLLSRDNASVGITPPPSYTLDGVKVHGYRGVGDPMPWFHRDNKADVVITHLENTQRAAALCGIYDIPLVHVIHNTEAFTKGALARGPVQLAVFNTDWMAQEYATYWASMHSKPMPPTVVVHPIVDPADYATSHGSAITLINLNEAKGGELFWRLAQALPAKAFLGVQGAYGEQVVDELDHPNVEVVGHMAPEQMKRKVYARTKILLMPSSYESYGRVGVEAACSGIPTIAHPTPGIREALGPSATYVDRDDLDGWIKAIKYLSTPRGYGAASKKALAVAKAQAPEADAARFVDAVEGVVRRGFATVAR